jgi:hypothetical protein
MSQPVARANRTRRLTAALVALGVMVGAAGGTLAPIATASVASAATSHTPAGRRPRRPTVAPAAECTDR